MMEALACVIRYRGSEGVVVCRSRTQEVRAFASFQAQHSGFKVYAKLLS